MPRTSPASPIVVGPMIRHVDQRRATLWLELDHEAAVFSTATAIHGTKRPPRVDSAVSRTIEVAGHHYAAIYFDGLAPATLYEYGITALFEDPRLITRVGEIRRSPRRVRLELQGAAMGRRSPAFRTLPEAPGERSGRDRSRPEALRLAFGSCRCFDGGQNGDTGPDILAMYAEELEAKAARRLTDWPHLLLLLGDQIYADDVSQVTQKLHLDRTPRPHRRPLLHPDWTEVDHRIAQGKVSPTAGGFHLYSFEDFAVTYRDAWSDRWVRKLLANVPTFMLPDDHELTDSFRITGSWLEQAVRDPPWRTTLASAMMAYWIYQGWGNVSADVARAHPFLRVIMREAEGARPLAPAGIYDPLFQLADKVVRGEVVAPAYYTIATEPPIIAMDARTDRRLVGPAPFPLGPRPPHVKIGAHPEDQMLGADQFAWLERELRKHETPIVASSVPLLQTHLADRMMFLYVRSEDPVPFGDIQVQADAVEEQTRRTNAETWFAFPRSLMRLLRLLATRETTYFLAGDVHYSYLHDTKVWHAATEIPTHDAIKRTLTASDARLIHVVCSPLQNEWREENVKTLAELGGRHKVDTDGIPVVDFFTPQLHPLRDEFGLPRPIWKEGARPARVRGRDRSGASLPVFGTRNCIAVLTWTAEGTLSVAYRGKSSSAGLTDLGAWSSRR